jgi:hypothetical protein
MGLLGQPPPARVGSDTAVVRHLLTRSVERAWQGAYGLEISVPRGGETARSAMSRRAHRGSQGMRRRLARIPSGWRRSGCRRGCLELLTLGKHGRPDPASAAETRNVSGAAPRCTDSGSMVDLAGEQSTGLVAMAWRGRAGSGIATPGASIGHRRPGAAGRVATYCSVAARHPAQGWRVRARRRTSHGTEAMRSVTSTRLVGVRPQLGRDVDSPVWARRDDQRAGQARHGAGLDEARVERSMAQGWRDQLPYVGATTLETNR